MVVTMEPGIYIPDGSNCDERWWGIGIRIEDDILVTKTGPENLSAEAPRTIEEIEKMMAKKSILDFSTKLPVGLFGLIKTKSLVLSVIKDKIFSGSNFKSLSSVRS